MQQQTKKSFAFTKLQTPFRISKSFVIKDLRDVKLPLFRHPNIVAISDDFEIRHSNEYKLNNGNKNQCFFNKKNRVGVGAILER